MTTSLAGTSSSICHITVIEVGARSCRYGPFSIFGAATAVPAIPSTQRPRSTLIPTRIRSRAQIAQASVASALLPLAITQRGERADQIARRFRRVAVAVDQGGQATLRTGARLDPEVRRVARQHGNEVRDALGDRLLVLLEVRV